MLTVFPAEMYKDEQYRVVHSQEETQRFLSDGWIEEIPRDKKRSDYTVHHADKKRGPGRPAKSEE